MDRRKGLLVGRLSGFHSRVKAYHLYLVIVSGVGLLFPLLGLLQFSPAGSLNFFLLLALAILIQLTSTSFAVGEETGITYTIAPAVTLAIVPFYGPAAAALAEALSSTVLWLAKPADARVWKKSLPQLIFNIGMGSIAIYLSGQVFLYTQDRFAAGTLPGIILPWLGAALVNDQVNLGLLIGILTLQHDEELSPLKFWQENLWAMPIGVLSMSVGGAILAFAVLRLDWVGVFMFFLPIVLTAYADRVYVRQMQEHMDHLEEIVAERTRETSELMREKDAFLAVLTHDMKSPLTTIGLYAELIKKQPHLVENRPEFSDVILRSQRALTEIVDNILDVEKLQSGQALPIQMETFELGPLLEWVKDSASALADRKDISISLEIRSAPLVVMADRQYLERIYNNLFSNAVKYTPDGGQVWVRARREQGEIQVEVEDTGYGIPAEEVAHIFEPFRRVPQHIDKAGGTGLGLSITKALVEAHGGQIHVASEEGVGSTFTVSLPIMAGQRG